jgi:hypothetical protein
MTGDQHTTQHALDLHDDRLAPTIINLIIHHNSYPVSTTAIIMYPPPHLRLKQDQTVPKGMNIGLTDRISIISSATVIPNPDIAFKSPMLVGSYNWVDDKENKPIIAVPGKSSGARERHQLMVGLPDLWIDNDDEVGQLRSDDQIPGYVEYPDRMSPHVFSVGPAHE